MEAVYADLTTRARGLYQRNFSSSTPRPERILIALAGPPGSGKSTVAAEIVRRLNAEFPNTPYAAVLPMDGFHLTRATLDAMPNKEEAHARRGAAWTFDAHAVVDLITALHNTRNDLLIAHKAPSFDHATKDPIADAIEIDGSIQLVVLEGNWLLYNEAPWSAISTLVDETWFIDVEEELALHRVANRHMRSGIETDWKAALYRARNNDMRNGDEVRARLVPPVVRIRSVEEG